MTITPRMVYDVVKPGYRKSLSFCLEERRMISHLVYACRPSPADFQAAKNRPKLWVGPVIYPPASPDPNGPQYEPINPQQWTSDNFG